MILSFAEWPTLLAHFWYRWYQPFRQTLSAFFPLSSFLHLETNKTIGISLVPLVPLKLHSHPRHWAPRSRGSRRPAAPRIPVLAQSPARSGSGSRQTLVAALLSHKGRTV